MNLIVNRHLDRSQEQAIYELTLKKQRSKKSTISQKQLEAMQQLATELVPQRKDLTELMNSSSTSSTNQSINEFNYLCRCNSNATTTTTISNHITNELQRQSSTSTIATSSTSSSSNSSSLVTQTNATTNSLPDETHIKLNQMRLEHLNAELKRRLNQYEYLVAQEKAILGAYNMALFTNEGVNNFHLYRLGQKF